MRAATTGEKMADEISVHDNVVYAYSVDCAGRRLILHTEHRPPELTDVVFRDVVAHWFEHVQAANVLLDVDERDVADFVHDNEALFAKSWRYGWPSTEYRGDLGVLVQQLRAASTRAYLVLASAGLSGWVLAGGCERIARTERARVG